MPLLIRKGVEADIDRILDIQWKAFGPDPWYQTLFPNGISSETATKSTEYARTDMLDPRITFMTVIDTDRDNEIIAFGKWHIYKKERPESEWNKSDSRDWAEDTNREALQAYFTALGERRRKYMAGKPHCLLGILDTHPNHQRRGAGGMLVQWGTDIADAEGLPCYLEASPAGYHLYRSKGFEDVDVVEMDLSYYGGKGNCRHACMIRPAKSV